MWETSKVCDSQITDLSKNVTTNPQVPLLCHSVRLVIGSWLIDNKLGNAKSCLLLLVRMQTRGHWVASPGLTVFLLQRQRRQEELLCA